MTKPIRFDIRLRCRHCGGWMRARGVCDKTPPGAWAFGWIDCGEGVGICPKCQIEEVPR